MLFSVDRGFSETEHGWQRLLWDGTSWQFDSILFFTGTSLRRNILTIWFSSFFYWNSLYSQYLYIIDHVERKVPKYENHKLRERKVKLLPGIEEITKGTGAHKHTETELRYFDWHGHLPQSKESKCLWTHDKDGVCLCVPVSFVISSIPGKSFHFPFPNLWFSYLGTFLSTWSI